MSRTSEWSDENGTRVPLRWGVPYPYRTYRFLCAALSTLLTLVPSLLGQALPNPVPFVNQPLVPTVVAPGGPAFTLTVNGTGFVSGATVNWNGAPLTTTFVSASQLTADVPATKIASAGTASITVTNPSPGGGVSNVVYFGVAVATADVVLQQTTHLSGSYELRAITTADLDGDSIADLVLDHGGSALGNGDGSFQPPTSKCGGFNAFGRSVVPGDFNNDGILDVGSMSHWEQVNVTDVYVCLGSGDGTFQPASFNYELPYYLGPIWLVAGDFNGDGNLDLAGTNLGVLLGNGDGTFQTPPVGSIGGDALAVGDFNADGKLDLAGAPTCGFTGCTPGYATVLLGNGDGTFAPPTGFPVTASSLANPTSAANFKSGSIVPPAIIPIPENPYYNSILAADLNGDGRLDLAVVANITSGVKVSTLLGNGDGTFAAPAEFGIGYWSSHATWLIAGDFNADGMLDLAVATSEGYVVLGNGDGTFQTPKIFSATTPYYPSLAAADFNRDGRLDLAAVDPADVNGVNILLQPAYVEFSPASLTFNNQTVGVASAPQAVKLTNNGPSPLTLTSIGVTGTNSGDFSQTNDCPVPPSTLPVQSSCNLNLVFTPTATGSRTASLTVEDDGPGSPHTVGLSGTAINPVVTLSPTSLDFGDQTLFLTSDPQVVTLTNSGVGPLTISSVSVSFNFEQTNTCGASVPEGGQCTISVTFTPSVGGTRTGTVTIADNAADSPQIINLTGTGIPAGITLSTTSLDFGTQPVNTTSAPQAVTVTNSGGNPLLIFWVEVSEDFGVAHDCPLTPSTIPPGGTCTISVSFIPKAGGLRAGALTVSDNAAGNPQTVALGGTGILPTVTVSPMSVDFGGQNVGTTSPPQSVTITNSGPGPLTITTINPSAGFSQTNNCVGTVEASTSCTINVTFTPTALGTNDGHMNINMNAASGSQAVILTGTGVPPLTLSTQALTFTDQVVGVPSAPLPVVLTNTGSAPLAITGILASAPFAQSNDCPASLSVGAKCTINVTFTATAAGTTFGVLLVSDNAPDSPHSVSLTGIASVGFGTLNIGVTSAPQSVAIMNGSSTVVTVSGITTTGDFAKSGSCGTIQPGGNCAVNVTFTPSAPGTRTGALIVSDNRPGSPHAIGLSGMGADFTMEVQSGGSASATVNAGQTATFNLQLAPTGFTGNVTLTCAYKGTTPRGASCAVSPATLSLNGVDPAPFAVNAGTAARSMAVPRGSGPWGWRTLTLLACLLLVLAKSSRRGSQSAKWVLASLKPSVTREALAVVLMMVLLWATCGGTAPPVGQQTGTPAGTYTLTISATTSGYAKTLELTLKVN